MDCLHLITRALSPFILPPQTEFETAVRGDESPLTTPSHCLRLQCNPTCCTPRHMFRCCSLPTAGHSFPSPDFGSSIPMLLPIHRDIALAIQRPGCT
ncbi:hypothetical protein K438DRAFT_347672 [Mycena galopus ATCC 62051]|nr:hypothetical protein K438DRAFT_347672 [Mycena galopus ATCC 62051]